MDATYKADFRELNELNFARFDAKVGERLAQLETRLNDRLGHVKSDLLKWMLTFWVSTLVGLGALFFRG